MLMLTENLNVPLSKTKLVKSSTEEMERRQKKRKREIAEKTSVKKINDSESKWRPEDCAQPRGNVIKFTGEGENKKFHYKKFKFHGVKYRLEDSVLLVPGEEAYQKPYVAIIKDIYREGIEGYIKLDVQWFYRPEDVDKKYLGKWKPKDSRDLFYSFHRDEEVFAESVKRRCLVYFVSEDNVVRREEADFVVEKVYDISKKKLRNLTHNGFSEQQKHEIGLLLEKTPSSRVSDLPRTEKEIQTLKPMYAPAVPEKVFKKVERRNHESTSVVNAQDQEHEIGLFLKKKMISRDGDLPVTEKRKSRRKQYIPKRFIKKVETTEDESFNFVNDRDYKSMLEEFYMLTGDSYRDKRLYELLEAVKHKENHACDVVHMVRSLEQTLYDYLGNDKPKYNHKLEVLLDKLKDQKKYTIDELMTVIKEPVSNVDDDPSTSKNARH